MQNRKIDIQRIGTLSHVVIVVVALLTAIPVSIYGNPVVAGAIGIGGLFSSIGTAYTKRLITPKDKEAEKTPNEGK